MKKYFLLFVALLAILLSFFSCQKEEDPTKTPKVTVESVEVSDITASFSWTVDWLGKFASVVEVSENEDMSDSQTFGSETESENKDFTATANGLKEVTRYYYRFLIWNKNFVNNKFMTDVKSFTTISGVPKVKTTEVTEVTRSTATVICEVTDESGASVTERGLCWGTTQNPTTGGNHLSSGNGIGRYSVDLLNLEAGTEYYVRSYAKNENGIAYGEELCFNTLYGPPIVITSLAFNITSVYAECGGRVESDGGFEVTECGIYFGITPTPLTSGTKIVATAIGNDSFTCVLSDLSIETTYYVCAYAVNHEGIGYGDVLSFSTLPLPSFISLPFSVSNEKQVYFSQGNLQYQASTRIWRFAEYQYDIIGDNNKYISANYNGWIDLFGWGTSGYNGKYPYMTSDNAYDYGYGGDIANTNYDWGVYNMISNGGNQAGLWRTLLQTEWCYVLWYRQASTVNGVANARYAMAKVANVQGVILFPDNYTHPNEIVHPLGINEGGAGWSANNYSASEWAKMEAAGCVFLPATGYRRVTSVNMVGSTGDYWSADGDEKYVSSIGVDSNGLHDYFGYHTCGSPVRLVRNAQ